MPALNERDRQSLKARPETKVVFWVAWGEVALAEVARSFDYARRHIDALFVVVTDSENFLLEGLQTLHFRFEERGFFRKAEVFAAGLFPPDSTVLFLDTDTCVLDDVEMGFAAASRHGLALAPAPTYLLDEYRATANVLTAESLELAGQLLFNSGVVFFRNSSTNQALFAQWLEICHRHAKILKGDQEALTIAMEKMYLNPYVLSKSYNLRGIYEPVIGRTRIWHHRLPPPINLNVYDQPYPPRLLAKAKVRELRRAETHGDSLRFFITERIVNPCYRLVRGTRLGRKVLG